MEKIYTNTYKILRLSSEVVNRLYTYKHRNNFYSASAALAEILDKIERYENAESKSSPSNC